MGKRFTDTEIWDKEWFMQLPPKQKCLVKYVRDKCDLAGIWSPNYLLASVYIGEQVFEDDLLLIDDGNQFEKISDGKIYCTGFIDFQYGSSLNPQSPVHKKIIDILAKHNIEFQLKENYTTKSSFVPPTLMDVCEEMMSKTDEYNAQMQSVRFHSYYESNGWMVGKNKMKNWRSAAIGWINRSKPEKKPISSEDIKKSIKSIANRKINEL
jgi:hypothetical protein